MEKKRVYAGFIDFMIACIIQTFLIAVFFIKPILNSVEDLNIIDLMLKQLTISYCSTCYLIVRDIIGKRSIGKRIMKLRIVDKTNGNNANFIKRLLRNITWLLGPIEIILFLISKERLGDKIAMTFVTEFYTKSK